MPGIGRNVSKRRRLVLGAAAIVVVLAVLGLKTLRSNTAIDPSKLATVERGSIARSVVATGKVQPQVKVEVKSKASGIVKEILSDYGDTVKEGQIVCIIEAMKLMNEIETRAAGRIAKILVENGQAVEYGQPLFLIEPSR